MDLGDKDDMRDYDRIHRFIESTYKNILKNFNPGVKQLIALGKALQKTKQNVGASFKAYNECLYEVARMAEACKGATKDLGIGLVELTDSQSEINQQLIDGVKVFHAEFLIPLKAKQETEFKHTQELLNKYLSGHKKHLNNLRKAQTTLERYRKKHKSKPSGGQKEMEKARKMRDCKKKLEDYLKTNLRQALVEERKRYCYLFNRLLYVVEDQVKKYSHAVELLTSGLQNWPELCKSSHSLPRSSEQVLQEFGLTDESGDLEEDHSGEEYHSTISVGTALSLNRRDITPKVSDGGHTGSSAADQVKLETSSTGPGRGSDSTPDDVMRKFSAPTKAPPEVISPPAVLCAVYPYVAATEVQLSLEANDPVRVFGEAYNGWVYGRNVRTNREGWFPLSFTDFNEDLLHWKASLLSRYQLLTHARNASLTNLRSAWHSELDFDLGRRLRPRRPSRGSEAEAAELSAAAAAVAEAKGSGEGTEDGGTGVGRDAGAPGGSSAEEEDAEDSVIASKRVQNRRTLPLEPISEQFPPPKEFRDTPAQVPLQLTKVATVVSSSENSEQDDPAVAEGGETDGGEREEKAKLPAAEEGKEKGGGPTFGEDSSAGAVNRPTEGESSKEEGIRRVVLVESTVEDGGGGGGGKGGWGLGGSSSLPSFLNAKLPSPPVLQRPRSCNTEAPRHAEEGEEGKKGVAMETRPSPSFSSGPGQQPTPPPAPPPPLPIESYQPRNDYFAKPKLRKAGSDESTKAN